MTIRLVQLGLGGWGRSWVQEVTRRSPGRDGGLGRPRSDVARGRGRQLGLPPDRVFAALEQVPARLTARRRSWSCRWRSTPPRRARRSRLGCTCWWKSRSPRRWPRRPSSWPWPKQRAKLMVNQNYRWFPAPLLARRLVRERRSGPRWAATSTSTSCSTRATATSSWPSPCSATWRSITSTPCASCSTTSRSRSSCQSWNEPASLFQGRPAAVATIRFARGTVVSYRGSWISRGPTTPYGGHWRIDGTEGAIEFRFRGALPERETLDALMLYRSGQPAEAAAPAGAAVQGPQGGARRLRALDRGRRRAPEGAEHRRRQPAQLGADVRGDPVGARRRAPVRVADLLGEVGA